MMLNYLDEKHQILSQYINNSIFTIRKDESLIVKAIKILQEFSMAFKLDIN